MMKRSLPDDETLKLLRRIAGNIKEKRMSMGLKQADMTNFGFGYRWYQRLESGRHIPTLPTLIKLARSLGMEITDLFR